MYKVINLYLTPIESDVSRFKIEEQCNIMANKGYELITMQVLDSTHVSLIFKKI